MIGMIKTDENIKQGVQSEEKPIPEANEQVMMMFDALEKNYNEDKINERVEALRKFREEVSVFSLRYDKFESEQQPKLKGLPVFDKGLKFYNEHNELIIQELDNEIKRSEQEIAGIKAFREKQLKAMMMVLHANPHTLHSI